MASYPASTGRRAPASETASGAFWMVAALLLGLTVAVVGFFALMMWADARDARDAAAGRERARDGWPRSRDRPQHRAAAEQLRGRRAGERGRARGGAQGYDATLPPAPAGDVVKVQMTLKDMTVEIAPGVKYNTWAFDGHGAPGPVIHVREGQTVEMTLTNGGAIPHSIDFHAARIAPNVAFKDVAPGDSIKFSFKASDPGVFMYHCGTKPVLAHIANGMYGAIVVQPKAGPAAGRQRVRARRQRVVPERRRDRRAGLARHGEGPRADGRLGDVQRLREPVRHASADR